MVAQSSQLTSSTLAQQRGARAAFLLHAAHRQPGRPGLCAANTENSPLCSLPGPSEETLGEREASSAGRDVMTEICKAG